MRRTSQQRGTGVAAAVLAGMLAVSAACSGPILRTDPPPTPPPVGVSEANRSIAPRTSPLSVGGRVPAFELMDQNSVPVSAGELMTGGRGSLLLFLPADGDAAARPAYDWARRNMSFLRQQRIELVLVVPHGVEDNARLAQREELRLAVLADPHGWVMRGFGVVPQGAAAPRSPHAMLIASDGRVHLSEAGLPSPSDAVVAAETRPGQQRDSIFQLF